MPKSSKRSRQEAAAPAPAVAVTSEHTLTIDPYTPLAFTGSVELQVVAGRVRVLGCELTADDSSSMWHTIHSPAGGLTAALQTPSAINSGTRVLLRRIEPAAQTSSNRQRSNDDNLYTQFGLQTIPVPSLNTRLGSIVPLAWEATIDALAPLLASSSAVVLLCGARNVGKSSFGRLLLNRALGEGAQRLRFLESDLGQCEFTPPGLVALHDIAAPCLGPPHTHLRAPRACRFVGDTSPAEQPTQYVACVAALLAEHRKDDADDARPDGAPAPSLVVNTCGWVTGLGGQLLADVIAAASPTHIILLEGPASRPPTAALDAAAAVGAAVVRLPALSSFAQTPAPAAGEPDEIRAAGGAMDEEVDGTSTTPPPADDDNASGLAAPRQPSAPPSHESRALQLLAYLGALPNGARRLPGDPLGYMHLQWSSPLSTLLAAPPIAVPLASLLHVSPALPSHASVARCLNASFVALLCAPTDPITGEPIPASDATRGWASHQCVGLALVRSVDEASGTLFLSTPVPPAQLVGVNVLARASLDAPVALLQPTALTPASPFLAADALKTGGAGGKNMRSRHNLVRGPKA